MIELETDRLILQEIDWKHLDKIHYLYSLPETSEFNSFEVQNIEQTKAEVLTIIENRDAKRREFYCWTLIDRISKDFIGIRGLTIFEERFKLAKVYCMIIPSFWGRGYATESLKIVLTFGFEKLGLHRIEAGAHTENASAIRVLEKCGMHKEGVRRELLPIKGRWRDCYLYSILESEYKRNKRGIVI